MRTTALPLLLAVLAVPAADALRLDQARGARVPPDVVGGGVALAELVVDQGRVTGQVRLSGSDAFLNLLAASAAAWRFAGSDASGRVLAVGVFRPPELLLDAPLLRPPDRVTPSPELPAPLEMATPAYPPDAVGDGSVVVEIRVAPTGEVAGARAVTATAGFEQAALEAARRWRFRPARREDHAVASLAVGLFVFREPLALPPGRR